MADAGGEGAQQTCAVRRGREAETADAKSKRQARTVAEPVMDAGWSIEYSVHKLTPATMEDARVCFQNELDEEMTRLGVERKERKSFLVENLLGVPTWQPAPRWESILKGDWASCELDLSLYPNQEVNQVRKQLYNKVVLWAGAMRDALKKRGYWCNTACPITGSCMFGDRTAHVYNELTGLTMMLNYDSVPIGCCGIVLHPSWGRAAYPVTLFTLAPYDVLKDAAAEVLTPLPAPWGKTSCCRILKVKCKRTWFPGTLACKQQRCFGWGPRHVRCALAYVRACGPCTVASAANAQARGPES